MSSNRKIWNDGEGVVTPELQRMSDIAASADDRVYDVLFTPGTATKKVLPLVSEPSGTIALNPSALCIPSSTNGKVTVQPALFVASDTLNPQKVLLTGTLYAAADSALIASNNTINNRYDLVYVTLTRSISATAARRVKSTTDGSVSLQTLNVQDSPTITIGINQGFLTGATAPTAAQISAAVPADTATAYSFPIAYVTTNAYSSGAQIATDANYSQSLRTGAYITQAWPGGWIHGHRLRGMRPTTMNTGDALTSTTNQPTPTYSERWGSDQRVLLHLKAGNSHTPTTADNSVWGLLDTKFDWSNRLVFCIAGYLGSAATDLTGYGNGISALTGGSSPNCTTAVLYTGTGNNPGFPFFNFSYGGVGGPTLSFYVGVYNWIYYYKSAGTFIDTVNGDQIAIQFMVSDRLVAGM